MPDITISSFPIQAKNPKDRPLTSTQLKGSTIGFVMIDGINPRAMSEPEMISYLFDILFKSLKECDSDEDAAAQGVEIGMPYVVSENANLKETVGTIRRRKV